MVAIAAISGVGEEPVRVLIVADKLVATRRSGQCAGLSAETAAPAFLLILRFRLRSFGGAGLCHSPLFSAWYARNLESHDPTLREIFRKELSRVIRPPTSRACAAITKSTKSRRGWVPRSLRHRPANCANAKPARTQIFYDRSHESRPGFTKERIDITLTPTGAGEALGVHGGETTRY